MEILQVWIYKRAAGSPTSYWIIYSSKLRFYGINKKSKKLKNNELNNSLTDKVFNILVPRYLNGKDEVILLTFDCIGLLYPQLIEIRQQLKSKVPAINSNHIVMTSTHTHAGPDVVGIWGKDFAHTGVNEQHLQKIVNQAVQAIQEAYFSKKSVDLFYTNGNFGEDWVKNISEPNEIDRSVSVLQLKDKAGKNIATLTNFACHPTIMDDATTAASADWARHNSAMNGFAASRPSETMSSEGAFAPLLIKAMVFTVASASTIMIATSPLSSSRPSS